MCCCWCCCCCCCCFFDGVAPVLDIDDAVDEKEDDDEEEVEDEEEDAGRSMEVVPEVGELEEDDPEPPAEPPTLGMLKFTPEDEGDAEEGEEEEEEPTPGPEVVVDVEATESLRFFKFSFSSTVCRMLESLLPLAALCTAAGGGRWLRRCSS